MSIIILTSSDQLEKQYMIKMKRIISILLLVVSLCCQNLQAHDERMYSHHVIIALDNAGTSSWITNEEVGYSVKKALDSTYPSIGITKPLLQKGDYISIVKFDARTTADAVDKYYVKNALGNVPPMSKSDDINALHNASFPRLWNTIKLGQSGNNFSILSVAKPYILQGTSALVSSSVQERTKVSRTFLIMVTDHHYNGNDFYDEINCWTQFTLGNNKVGCRILADSLSAFCRKVEQDYYIRYVATDTLHSLGGRKYVEIYEYQPLQQHFTLPSVVSFPAKLKAKRVIGGKYKIYCPISYQNEQHFSIDKLEIDLLDENGEKVELIEKEVLIDLQQEREVNFEFDDSYKKTIKSVRIRGWVRINDGFYGFTQLVPYENAPTFLGNKGLTVNVEVEFEEDGKLFGLLRMPDFLWWFYHSDQAMGALMMSFTILLLTIIGLVAFLGKALHYHPKESQMQLRKIR